jgi:hypothetical protein
MSFTEAIHEETHEATNREVAIRATIPTGIFGVGYLVSEAYPESGAAAGFMLLTLFVLLWGVQYVFEGIGRFSDWWNTRGYHADE